jgi:hypothetical protein
MRGTLPILVAEGAKIAVDEHHVSSDAGWLRAAQMVGGLLLFLGLLATG